jgi:hypothetical protein
MVLLRLSRYQTAQLPTHITATFQRAGGLRIRAALRLHDVATPWNTTPGLSNTARLGHAPNKTRQHQHLRRCEQLRCCCCCLPGSRCKSTKNTHLQEARGAPSTAKSASSVYGGAKSLSVVSYLCGIRVVYEVQSTGMSAWSASSVWS